MANTEAEASGEGAGAAGALKERAEKSAVSMLNVVSPKHGQHRGRSVRGRRRCSRHAEGEDRKEPF